MTSLAFSGCSAVNRATAAGGMVRIDSHAFLDRLRFQRLPVGRPDGRRGAGFAAGLGRARGFLAHLARLGSDEPVPDRRHHPQRRLRGLLGVDPLQGLPVVLRVVPARERVAGDLKLALLVVREVQLLVLGHHRLQRPLVVALLLRRLLGGTDLRGGFLALLLGLAVDLAAHLRSHWPPGPTRAPPPRSRPASCAASSGSRL